MFALATIVSIILLSVQIPGKIVPKNQASM